MLQIGDTIFSLDILEKKFVCDLQACLGCCCRYGDAGAPLTDEEASVLNVIWPVVRTGLRPEGVRSVEEQGTSIKDIDNEPVTPLIDNKECAYTIMNDGIYMCGIEQAWFEGKVSFRKPVSCHLFPVRIKQFRDFRAVNYVELPLCSAARTNGKKKGIYVYEFLKIPLIRVLGEERYNELCTAAEELRNQASG